MDRRDETHLHERAGALFVRLRRLPASEREAAIEVACGDDAALRREVLALLDGDAAPGLEPELLVRRFQDEALRLVDSPGSEPPLPERIGGCRIVRRLGAGGMGTVHEAIVETSPHLEPGLAVAVKVLHPHLMESPTSLERLRREGVIGQSIRHPNVVRTFECASVTVEGRRIDYLVMELVHGRTLQALQAELGALPEDLCRHVALEVARGLAAIHAAGIVHRDIKPENLIITNDDVVKIMDLGIARGAADDARLTRTGAFVGSLQYAAPEQLGGRGQVDARADLHSLGVVLHEMASGSNPFEADDWLGVMRRVLHEPPRRLGEASPRVTPFFEELVQALLEKSRERRIASAEELAEILGLGEDSLWWMSRAQELRETTRRALRRPRLERPGTPPEREHAMAELRAAFLGARDGAGQVVLVDGVPGSGKTRLVEELVARLRDEGEDLDFLHGSYAPEGAMPSTGAFTTALREHFGEWELEELLAATPSKHEGAGGPSDVTDAPAVVRVLGALEIAAAERVAVVLIDDLHLAPPGGRELFAALAERIAGRRILLVGAVASPAGGAGIASPTSRSRVTRIRLEGGPDADDLGARLARLSEHERLLLDVAACAGHEIDRAIVGAVAGLGRIRLLETLARIELRSGLVRALGRRHVFAHHRVQERLLEALDASRRQELQGRILVAAARAPRASAVEALDPRL